MANNVFILDDGSREYILKNNLGETVCVLHMRAGDMSILERFKAVEKDFAEIVKPITDMDIKNDGTPEFEAEFEAMKTVESEMVKRLSVLFDTEDIAKIFEKRNMFSSIGGKFYVERVLDVLGNVVSQAFEEEAKLSKERTDRFLSDLQKG